MKQIMDGKFVFTGELEPVKTTNIHEIIEGAKILKGHVVTINITDNPTALGYMNALVPSYLIQKEAGVEAVYQMTTRDRNCIALLSDVSGRRLGNKEHLGSHRRPHNGRRHISSQGVYDQIRPRHKGSRRGGAAPPQGKTKE